MRVARRDGRNDMGTLGRLVGLGILGLFGSVGVASAATLRTPLMIGSSFIACVATNIGTKPTDVTVTVTDAAGAVLPPVMGGDLCNGTPLLPQKSCLVQVTEFSGAIPIGGFCTFTSKGKLKAVGYATSGATSVGFVATK